MTDTIVNGTTGSQSDTPLRFAFGVHIHQPVGNFDHVFEQHVADVYQPFLQRIVDRQAFPISMHISGPLLEWLEARGTAYLDLVGRLVAEGKIELLLAGMYEPLLVSLPRQDRIEQIQWMREALQRRFGVTAEGLWLTERVWEPELAQDLADAGVRFALVDDRHFLITGFRREQLHAPYWTEAQGRKVALFPIDERLRYLIPFRPAKEIVAYFEDLWSDGHKLAVFADDGEKFGGWPGTSEWVYGRRWLEQFLDEINTLQANGTLRLTTFGDALSQTPSHGLAYLPSASYREMEEWSLPAEAAIQFGNLMAELGEERLKGPVGALVRGGHWRNFLVKYPESNRMHKKMQALSFKCRERGNPAPVRRAIGRAQCNDAYWHGVFGGLYLPHLRRAIWHQLALAECELRQGENLVHEFIDLDADGNDEIWLHSAYFSALVSPARGAAVEEYTIFDRGLNYADVLARRREAYHRRAVEKAAVESRSAGDQADSSSGTASIHDIEHAVVLSVLPPIDQEDRALFVDRVLPGSLRFDEFARGDYPSIRSWARAPMVVSVELQPDAVELICRPARPEDQSLVEKRLAFDSRGRLRVSYRWNPEGLPADALFSTELTVAQQLPLKLTPDVPVWTFAVQTVAKSERGLDETMQGESITARWPVPLGQASVELSPGNVDP